MRICGALEKYGNSLLGSPDLRFGTKVLGLDLLVLVAFVLSLATRRKMRLGVESLSRLTFMAVLTRVLGLVSGFEGSHKLFLLEVVLAIVSSLMRWISVIVEIFSLVSSVKMTVFLVSLSLLLTMILSLNI